MDTMGRVLGVGAGYCGSFILFALVLTKLLVSV